MSWRHLAAILPALALAQVPAFAHDAHKHETPSADVPVLKKQDLSAKGQDRLPLDVDFEAALPLEDHHGVTRDLDSLKGAPILLFFGYAHCEGICLAALPLMGEATALLEKDGIQVTPLMITIDPARDTLETLASNLAKYHQRFLGLTGSEAALERARMAFNVQASVAITSPSTGDPVYKHGTFIYILDRHAELVTVVPPILSPEALAMIIKNDPTITAGS